MAASGFCNHQHWFHHPLDCDSAARQLVCGYMAASATPTNRCRLSPHVAWVRIPVRVAHSPLHSANQVGASIPPSRMSKDAHAAVLMVRATMNWNRRIVLITLACTCTAITLVVFAATRLPSDEAMMANFSQQRRTFDQLTRMFIK